MSEDKIIENGQYLAQSLQVLRDHASAMTTAPGQEVDTRELSRFTDVLKLALSDIESIRDTNRSREASIIEREAELEALRKDADERKLEMSKVAASSLELHSSAQSTAKKLEEMRLAAEIDRNSLLDSLKSAAEKELSLVNRDIDLTRREQIASQAKEAADETSRLATETLETNSRLITENTNLQARLENELQEASRAQQKSKEAEAAFGRSQAAFEKEKGNLGEAQLQLDQEKQAAVESSAALDEEKRRVDTMQEQAKSLRAEAERILHDARSQKSASELLDRESESRRASVDREKQLVEEAHKRAAGEREQTEAELEQAKAEREQAKAERAQASKDRESTVSLLEKIKDQYEQATQDRVAAASMLEAAWEQRAQDRASGASLLKDASADRAQVAALLQQASDQMARLDEDRAEAAYSADSARTEQAEDRVAIASVLQKARDVLQVSEEAVQRRIQDLEESRDALRDELDRRTSECQARQEQCASLRRDLDDQELTVRRASESVDKAEERAEELNRTVRDLESQLQSADAKADALQDQVRDLKPRLQSAEERTRTLQYQALTDAYERLRIEDRANSKVTAAVEQIKKEVAKLKSQSDDDSAMLKEKLLNAERDLQDMREQCKRLRTDRGNRELESKQADDSRREKYREHVPAEGSPWKATLHCVFQYLAGLNPDRSGSYGTDFRGLDDERLMRPLTYFLAKKSKRDRFTAFLGASSKPDGWYCLERICVSGHVGLGPVEGRCESHEYNNCQLQVRHLDASSGGKTLDFRVPIPDDDDDVDDKGEGDV